MNSTFSTSTGLASREEFLPSFVDVSATPKLEWRSVEKVRMKSSSLFTNFIHKYLLNELSYSTLRAKTGKMEEPVNRELNVTRS